MNETEREEFVKVFMEGFEAVVVPHLEEFYTRFDRIDGKLEQHDRRFDDVESRLNRIERKLNAVVERQDDHSVRIKNLEDKAFHQN